MTQNCPKCQGKGYHTDTLRDLAGRQPDGLGIKATVPCDYPSCRNGKVTPESRAHYYKTVCGLGSTGA